MTQPKGREDEEDVARPDLFTLARGRLQFERDLAAIDAVINGPAASSRVRQVGQQQ